MKSVMIHAALSVFGLLLAYQTWTRQAEVEKPSGEITLAECTAAKFVSVGFETPVHWVTTEKKPTSTGVEYWITSQKKPAEPTSDGKPKTPAAAPKSSDTAKPGAAAAPGAASSTDAAKAPPDAAKPAEPAKPLARQYDPDAPFIFLGNAELAELLKKLMPLKAVRALGKLPKGKEAAFGFDKPGNRMHLKCGGPELVLDFGERTYGRGDHYVRDEKTKQIYLLDGQFSTDMQSGMYKYMQSMLEDFSMADVDEAVIHGLGAERRLVQRNRLVPDEARWVDKAEPDKRNELFGNWFERVAQLKASAYLAEGAAPGADLKVPTTGVTPVLTIEYLLEGKAKGKIEMVRADTAQGGFYYLRSEKTHRWVTTYDSIAKQVEDDLAMVLGVKDARPAQPPQKPAFDEAAP